MSPHPLEASHEHSESRRVEELDTLHIDDEVVVPGGDEVDKPLPQLGGCIDVNFACDLDDGAITLSPSGQCQIHESSILARPPCPPRSRAPRSELTGRTDASWRRLSSNRPLDSTTESCQPRRLPHSCAGQTTPPLIAAPDTACRIAQPLSDRRPAAGNVVQGAIGPVP